MGYEETWYCVACGHKFTDWNDKKSHKCDPPEPKESDDPRPIDQGRSFGTRLTDAEIMRRGYED